MRYVDINDNTFLIIDGFVKSQYLFLMSFPRRRESGNFKTLWIPAFAGMTRFSTFYDFINQLKNFILKTTHRSELIPSDSSMMRAEKDEQALHQFCHKVVVQFVHGIG